MTKPKFYHLEPQKYRSFGGGYYDEDDGYGAAKQYTSTPGLTGYRMFDAAQLPLYYDEDGRYHHGYIDHDLPLTITDVDDYDDVSVEVELDRTVVAEPPADDDDAKVAKFEELMEAKRLSVISGTADDSQYHIGSVSPDELTWQQSEDYAVWRNARDNWTRTGDEKYKAQLEAAVDFIVPPYARQPVVTKPEVVWHLDPDSPLVLLVIYLAAFVLGILIGIAIT